MDKHAYNYSDDFLIQDYNCVVCPICGGPIKHPYTGIVTSEQLEEDSNTCQWIEVQDEWDNTLGYHPICHRIHPHTLESENHKYVHYDLVEMANTWDDLTLAEKITRLNTYITHLTPLKEGEFVIETDKERITNIISSIENIYIDLSIQKTGNIKIIPHED